MLLLDWSEKESLVQLETSKSLILTSRGEISEEVNHNQSHAKWLKQDELYMKVHGEAFKPNIALKPWIHNLFVPARYLHVPVHM